MTSSTSTHVAGSSSSSASSSSSSSTSLVPSKKLKLEVESAKNWTVNPVAVHYLPADGMVLLQFPFVRSAIKGDEPDVPFQSYRQDDLTFCREFKHRAFPLFLAHPTKPRLACLRHRTKFEFLEVKDGLAISSHTRLLAELCYDGMNCITDAAYSPKGEVIAWLFESREIELRDGRTMTECLYKLERGTGDWTSMMGSNSHNLLFTSTDYQMMRFYSKDLFFAATTHQLWKVERKPLPEDNKNHEQSLFMPRIVDEEILSFDCNEKKDVIAVLYADPIDPDHSTRSGKRYSRVRVFGIVGGCHRVTRFARVDIIWSDLSSVYLMTMGNQADKMRICNVVGGVFRTAPLASNSVLADADEENEDGYRLPTQYGTNIIHITRKTAVLARRVDDGVFGITDTGHLIHARVVVDDDDDDDDTDELFGTIKNAAMTS
jgi:hypothetical protein